MGTKFFCLLLTICLSQNASGMKIDYKYDDCEEEYHSGATITLETNDTNPDKISMKSNYNKFCAAILRGANDKDQRYFDIKNTSEKHIEFARALMNKAYEVATEREIPITLSFYGPTGDKHNMLSIEWGPFQQEINKFYEYSDEDPDFDWGD